eukprot:Opistho-2@61934
MELEAQLWRDIGVGLFFAGQGNRQANTFAPGLKCPAVGRLHDAGAAASGDKQFVNHRLAGAVLGHQATESARSLVEPGVAHQRLGLGDGLGVACGLHLRQMVTCLVRAAEAGAAEHHHGVLYTVRMLRQIRLEHLQLKTNATGFAAQQEFGVGESQPFGIGLQGVAGAVVGLQSGPGVGESAVVQVLVVAHAGLLCLCCCQGLGLRWLGSGSACQPTQKTKGSLRSPVCLARLRCRQRRSDAFAVFAGAGIDFHAVALGHENRHADFKAGGDFGRLEHLARGVALDGGFGPGDFALDAGGQFNRDGLAVVEHHFDGHAVFQVVERVAHVLCVD